MDTYAYHRPGNVKEACHLLAELPDAQVLAGGTDLLFDIEAGVRAAQHVISLQGVDELARIEDAGTHLIIGAGATAHQVESSPLVEKHFPEMTEMVTTFASPQIRTRATVAGNICSAVPCGDFPVILIALGAEVELTSTRGTRTVLLAEFFTGPRETVRKPAELLTRILVPKRSASSRACFTKFRRRASNSLAVASVAAYLEIENGRCGDARIALGAVAPIPLLAKKAGASLTGAAVDEGAIVRAAQLARDEAVPITDVRGAEAYRRDLVDVLTRRALGRLVETIKP